MRTKKVHVNPYLQVGLPAVTVKKVLGELAPLRIHLAPPEEDSRWIELEPPSEVVFEPGLGIRIVTTGKFKFELAAIKIPAYLDRIDLRLTPSTEVNAKAHLASIPIEILDADLRFIPGLVDDFLVSQVNKALTPEASQLVFRFDELLSAKFEIAPNLEPLKAIGLKVCGSEMQVTRDELIMRVLYRIDVERETAELDEEPDTRA